jgi:drug/metabolite transporter (DMT)-like permease
VTPNAASKTPGLAAGLTLILLTLAAWTVTPLFIEFFSTRLDPWTSNGWRYGLSALMWLPFLLVTIARKKLPPGIFRMALWPAIFNSAAQVCFTTAYYHADPGLVTFGLRAQIIFVTLGAALLFPAERRVIRHPLFILGVALVVAGVLGVLLSTSRAAPPDPVALSAAADSNAVTLPAVGEAAPAGRPPGTLLGVFLAMGAGLGYGLYALAVRKCMVGVGSMLSFSVISQYTAAAMIVLMLLFGREHGAEALRLSLPIFAFLVLSAAIGIAIGHVLYYSAIARLGVAISTGIIQLQPFTVSLLSLAVYNERLSPGQWVGGTCAVLGAILMLTAQNLVLGSIKRDAAAAALAEEADPHG